MVVAPPYAQVKEGNCEVIVVAREIQMGDLGRARTMHPSGMGRQKKMKVYSDGRPFLEDQERKNLI
jgi:hypothetical protein